MPQEFIHFFYFNFFIIIIQLTIAASLFLRKNNTRANKLLAMVMYYPASTVGMNILFLLLNLHNLVFLNSVNIAVSLTFGPVLLAYLRLLQGRDIVWTGKFLLHFIPSALIFLSSIHFIAMDEPERVTTLKLILSGEENFVNFLNLLLLIHVLSYLYLARKEIKEYAASVQNFCSSIEGIQVKWMSSIVSCLTWLNVILLLCYAVPMIITGKAHIYSDLIATPAVSAILYGFMLYKGFSYHAIYDRNTYMQIVESMKDLNQFIDEKRKEEPVPRKFMPEDEKLEDIKNKIETLFTVNKAHAEPGLKLHMIAERLNMSPTLLSRYINSAFQCTFFDLVNRYRVEEAQKLLQEEANREVKIEYIGRMAGFNSKTTFFTVFKKHTQMTPSEYRNDLPVQVPEEKEH